MLFPVRFAGVAGSTLGDSETRCNVVESESERGCGFGPRLDALGFGLLGFFSDITLRFNTLVEMQFFAAGALLAATLPLAAPAVAQRPKLNYWCYQFLKESDDARANFARMTAVSRAL